MHLLSLTLESNSHRLGKRGIALGEIIVFFQNIFNIVMKRKFKQCWSTISPISTKITTTSQTIEHEKRP